MASKKTITINYLDHDLEVVGWYTEAEPQTWDSPAYDATFEIEAVFVEDFTKKASIYPFLHEDYVVEIENLCLEQIED